MISENNLRHIRRCTEEEGHFKSEGPTWIITLEESDSFFAVLYAHGAYGTKVNTKKESLE